MPQVEVLVAVPTHFAFLTLLGCTKARRVPVCELSPPSVLCPGCFPPCLGPLGGYLCFLSPSIDPAATTVPTIHPCGAEPLA